MEWTTERRYRRYEDWTQEEIKTITENMTQSPWHTNYHVEPKQDFSTIQMAFLTLMGSGLFFIKTFLLVQPTV